MPGEAVAGPSGAAHSSDSRATGFIETTDDIQDLESVSAKWAAVTHSSGCWTGLNVRCKRGDLYTVYSWLHGRRTCTFEVASGKGSGHDEDGDTLNSKWGRGTSAETPTTSQVSGHSAHSHGRTCWQCGRSHSKAVQFGPCFIAEMRCLLESHLAHSHQKPMRLRANLTTPTKYLQSWLRSWTDSEVDVCSKKSSVQIQEWRQRKRNASRSSSAADLEMKGSSGWPDTPTCSAFYGPVTNDSELSLRRTRRECGRTR